MIRYKFKTILLALGLVMAQFAGLSGSVVRAATDSNSEPSWIAEQCPAEIKEKCRQTLKGDSQAMIDLSEYYDDHRELRVNGILLRSDSLSDYCLKTAA